MSWKPSAEITTLRARARMLALVRDFFSKRGVLEVETPLLCERGVTDPHIEPLQVSEGRSLGGPRYLQTSPEYAMKRLLAAHGEPIFQIARAFRDGEAGARHNPEFSMLEWYRPGFDHHQLMAEVEELVTACLSSRAVHKLDYRELFLEQLFIDPMLATTSELAQLAHSKLKLGDLQGDRDMWLDLLMTHLVEPQLRPLGMCFVYDYPATQAALSRIVTKADVQVGQRFELYVDGLEVANGYYELTDAEEQRRRFAADNVQRKKLGLAEQPVDERLIEALDAGLPACSGVALGLDRLLMLMTGVTDIREVLAFSWERA